MNECLEIQRKMRTPALLAEKGQYLIKYADSPEEIESALRLRYQIFNVEQGKGLTSANDSGIDRDEFDDYCLHLVVEEKCSKKPVGTYRIHLGPIASSARGFYSSREYEMTGIEIIANQAIEVGRSCVSPEYRNGAVMVLLWSGISETLYRSGMRYLFGCVSLETTEPAAGWALYEHFKQTGKLSETLKAKPTSNFTLERCPDADIEAALSDKRLLLGWIPPLFKGYFRLGAAVCGEPAFDHEFGTIDFLILLDAAKLPKRYSKHFNVEMSAED